MAEVTDSQRVELCDVNDCVNPAQYQCLNCQDTLCNACKQRHEKKRKNHKILLYSGKAKRTCKKHSEEDCVSWCETCSEACCEKCVTTSHEEHEMGDLEEIIRTKKDILAKSLIGPLRKCLTNWENLLHEARQMTDVYPGNFQKLDEELVSHATRIHAVVEMSLTKVRRELEEICESKKSMLQSQQMIINKKYEEFKRNINQLENLYGNDISLLEHKLDIATVTVLPTLIRQPTPKFTKGLIEFQPILSMIGNLSTTVLNSKRKNSSHEANVTPQIDTSTSPPVSTFNIGYCEPFLACAPSSGLAWVKTDKDRLQLMDHNGVVTDTINTDFGFCGITVSQEGDVLFSDWKNRRIVSASKEATSWKIETLFSTRCEPWALCSLRNGDVVVTYNVYNGHRVIKYNREGIVLYEFDSKLFSYPFRVAVNKVNDDLYVSDYQKLFAFGKDHQLLYEYSLSGDTLYNFWDVCSDTNGHVLLTDPLNNRIHILHPDDGTLLQYIQPAWLDRPQYIDVDSKGHLWIVEVKGDFMEEEGEVKIVKICK